jgi:uncharacterized membrane protein YdbT with pleckstrin-like domain
VAKQHYKDSPSLKEKEAFKKYLAEDEELVIATSLSQAYLRKVFIIALAFPGAIFMLLGLGLAQFNTANLGYGLLAGLALAIVFGFLKAFLDYHANRYLLTTRRVLVKKGFFAVDLTSAMYDKITHIEVVQGFMDRTLLHHGNIIINTAGVNKNEIKLNYVDYPIEFKNLLERLINREREHYGKPTGVISTIEGEVVD